MGPVVVIGQAKATLLGGPPESAGCLLDTCALSSARPGAVDLDHFDGPDHQCVSFEVVKSVGAAVPVWG
ncbi:hypothetical protein [Mycobacteroides abscessus]